MAFTTASLLSPSTRRRAEDVLCRAGVYRPARNAYQRIFNREFFDARLEDREALRPLVPRGSLVFDVGANEGRMTELFTELGARVVAVEPNPELAERVRSRYGRGRVSVEAVAVGDAPGTAELHLGRHNGHSTLSTEWRETMGPEGERWTGSVEVPVETLDRLIARHGRPDFLKVDVEGYEAQALAGLTVAVPLLSFEFLCDALEVAHACIARLRELGEYEFNLASGEDKGLLGGAWLTPDAALERLAQIAAANPGGYGDVYARERTRA